MLTTRQVAKILNVSEQTLMIYRAKKIGPRYIRTETGMIRYPEDGLQEYLKKMEVKSEDPGKPR